MADKLPWEIDWSAGVPTDTAGSAAPPWEMNWKAGVGAPHSDVGVAKDVGLSALSGVRDAPLAVTTTLPSMRELVTRGIQKLVDFAAPDSGIDLPKLEEETLKREIAPGVPLRKVAQAIS